MVSFQNPIEALVDAGMRYATDGTFINPDYPTNFVQANYFLVKCSSQEFDCSSCDDVKGLKWYKLDQLPIYNMLEMDACFCGMLKELLSQMP